LTFRSPSSGRFYARPAPDRDPFVKPGDIVKRGAAVAMLEVMKTFNRIQLAGDDLPDALRVVRVLPADGDDVEAGDVLLELELP
jgi:acetyl-CoA carboxylase biotin carboxyl carrier protein